MHRSFAASPAIALWLAAAHAQCTVSGVGMQTYGQGCNPVFANSPTLAVALDTTVCGLDITVQAYSGCCNTYLTNHVLALGAQQANVPLPQIGSGCVLLASLDAILIQPSSAAGVFHINLPPLVVPFTFFAQGGALYFTTIGFRNDLAMTAGAQVTLT